MSRPTIKELQAAGCESLRGIAAGLDERGIPAACGGKWSQCKLAGWAGITCNGGGSTRAQRDKDDRYV
jgi:hypothetical protein